MPAAPILPNNNVIRITPNHVLLIVVAGHQTKESVGRIRKAAGKMARELRKSQGKVIILIDASRILGRDYKAEDESIKTIEQIDFDIMAVYGLPPESRTAFEAAVAQKNFQNRVRAFNDKRSATSWLACHVFVHRGDPDFPETAICDVLPAE